MGHPPSFEDISVYIHGINQKQHMILMCSSSLLRLWWTAWDTKAKATRRHKHERRNYKPFMLVGTAREKVHGVHRVGIAAPSGDNRFWQARRTNHEPRNETFLHAHRWRSVQCRVPRLRVESGEGCGRVWKKEHRSRGPRCILCMLDCILQSFPFPSNGRPTICNDSCYLAGSVLHPGMVADSLTTGKADTW